MSLNLIPSFNGLNFTHPSFFEANNYAADPLQLPEILVKIFSAIPLIDRRSAIIPRVCRLWHQIYFDIATIQERLENMIRLDVQEIKAYMNVFGKKLENKIAWYDVIDKCENLRSLDLSNSGLRLSDVQKLASTRIRGLKKLILQGLPIRSLKGRGFASVTHLDVSHCQSISDHSLSSFSKISALCCLIMQGCLGLRSPKFAAMKQLVKLSLRECFKMRIAVADDLPRLKCIDLRDCSDLMYISLKKNEVLEKLYLDNCPSLLKAESYSFNSLKIISLGVCEKVGFVNFKIMPSLNAVSIRPKCCLTKISIDRLNDIEKIELENSYSLQELELTNLPKLRSIHFLGLFTLKKMHLKNLDGLKSMVIEKFCCLKSTHLWLENLPELQTFELLSCHSITKIDLRDFQKLNKVRIFDCIDLFKINLQGLTKLNYLHLSELPSLTSLHLSGIKRKINYEVEGIHIASRIKLFLFVDFIRKCMP